MELELVGTDPTAQQYQMVKSGAQGNNRYYDLVTAALHQQIVESPRSPCSTCDRTTSLTGAYNALYLVVCDLDAIVTKYIPIQIPRVNLIIQYGSRVANDNRLDVHAVVARCGMESLPSTYYSPGAGYIG